MGKTVRKINLCREREICDTYTHRSINNWHQRILDKDPDVKLWREKEKHSSSYIHAVYRCVSIIGIWIYVCRNHRIISERVKESSLNKLLQSPYSICMYDRDDGWSEKKKTLLPIYDEMDVMRKCCCRNEKRMRKK